MVSLSLDTSSPSCRVIHGPYQVPGMLFGRAGPRESTQQNEQSICIVGTFNEVATALNRPRTAARFGAAFRRIRQESRETTVVSQRGEDVVYVYVYVCCVSRMAVERILLVRLAKRAGVCISNYFIVLR